jgi:hypothetical protein
MIFNEATISMDADRMLSISGRGMFPGRSED